MRSHLLQTVRQVEVMQPACLFFFKHIFKNIKSASETRSLSKYVPYTVYIMARLAMLVASVNLNNKKLWDTMKLLLCPSNLEKVHNFTNSKKVMPCHQ